MRTNASPENIQMMAVRPLFKRIPDGEGTLYLHKFRVAQNTIANSAIALMAGVARHSSECQVAPETLRDQPIHHLSVVEWGRTDAFNFGVSSNRTVAGLNLSSLDSRIFPFYTRNSTLQTTTKSLYTPSFVNMLDEHARNFFSAVPLIVALTDNLTNLARVLRNWSAQTRRSFITPLVNDVLHARASEFAWQGNPFLADYYVRMADRVISAVPEVGEVIEATSKLDSQITKTSKELSQLTAERNDLVSEILSRSR